MPSNPRVDVFPLAQYTVRVRRTCTMYQYVVRVSRSAEGGTVDEEPEESQGNAAPEEPQADAPPDKAMTKGKLIYLAVAFVVFAVIVFFMLKDIIK